MSDVLQLTHTVQYDLACLHEKGDHSRLYNCSTYAPRHISCFHSFLDAWISASASDSTSASASASASAFASISSASNVPLGDPDPTPPVTAKEDPRGDFLVAGGPLRFGLLSEDLVTGGVVRDPIPPRTRALHELELQILLDRCWR